MKHISILVPRGHTSVANIDGSHQVFCEVNNILEGMNKAPLFKVELVGIAHDTMQRNGMFTINPHRLISDVDKTDLIIIPAILGNDIVASIEMNREFIPWIVDQYLRNAEVASFCVGTFFLASTGLLNGKQCATHWRYTNEFRNMFPQANLVNDKIITESNGLYTSGGAYSYVNLLAYLVEKYAGREVAVIVAKAFMIDIDRDSQSPFIMFKGQKDHEDEPIKKAQEFIENNFQEKITVDQLASAFALGRRSLERRFKKATTNTITEYIQRVKVEAAKKSFETSRKNIQEVMYDVGYSDIKAFRTVFKKTTGLSPLEYRNKYNKQAVA